jgi:hypothetical protein
MESFMRTKTEKRVFWFDDGKSPNVADALEKEKDIVVHRLAFNGPPADIWGAISDSQAYCITSTRQEVPEQYLCNAPLIARCPELLVVSTSGAGYDTVDVAACTAEGVLVVNQTGANADAVSEHAVGMMLSLTKNMPQTDRAIRAGKAGKREVSKAGMRMAARWALSASGMSAAASPASAAKDWRCVCSRATRISPRKSARPGVQPKWTFPRCLPNRASFRFIVRSTTIRAA